MGVGVGNQGVETVPGGLSLGLQLQRVISGFTEVPEFQNGVEVRRSVGRYERSPTGGTTDGVTTNCAATRRTVRVHGVTGDEDVVATRTGVASGEHDVAGQLPLDVGVVLRNLSLPEVSRFVEICTTKGGNSRRSVKNLKSVRDARDGAARAACRGITGWSRHWATTELEDVALGEKGRVLPKTLRALAPRRIVIDRKSAAHHGLVAAENLPGRANARLKSLPIRVYASRPAYTALIGDEKLACGGIRTCGNTRRNEIRHAPGGLGDGRAQIPRQAQIEGEIFGDS